jgi:hypothetical protein
MPSHLCLISKMGSFFESASLFLLHTCPWCCLLSPLIRALSAVACFLFNLHFLLCLAIFSLTARHDLLDKRNCHEQAWEVFCVLRLGLLY